MLFVARNMPVRSPSVNVVRQRLSASLSLVMVSIVFQKPYYENPNGSPSTGGRQIDTQVGSAPATSDSDVDQLFDTYNTVLLEVAGQLAPSRVIRRRPVARRLGLTPTAGHIAANVIVLNVVTGAHTARTTDAVG